MGIVDITAQQRFLPCAASISAVTNSPLVLIDVFRHRSRPTQHRNLTQWLSPATNIKRSLAQFQRRAETCNSIDSFCLIRFGRRLLCSISYYIEMLSTYWHGKQAASHLQNRISRVAVIATTPHYRTILSHTSQGVQNGLYYFKHQQDPICCFMQLIW